MDDLAKHALETAMALNRATQLGLRHAENTDKPTRAELIVENAKLRAMLRRLWTAADDLDEDWLEKRAIVHDGGVEDEQKFSDACERMRDELTNIGNSPEFDKIMEPTK